MTTPARNRLRNQSRTGGFTIVELMIALAIAGLISASIYTVFSAQQQNYVVQDQVSGMQQNLRAAVYMMAREIRMAGYDPTERCYDALGPGQRIRRAAPSEIQVTADLNGDEDVSDTDEDVAFGFSDANDGDDDGIADAGAANLGRDSGGGAQPIAQDIHAVGFAYAYDTDGDGNLERSAGGNVIWATDTDLDGHWDNLDTDDDGDIDAADGPGVGGNGVINGVATGTAVDTDAIRAVRIWILARAEMPDGRFANTNTYVVGRQVMTTNDNFRRRLLESTVKCRNMELQ